MLFDVMFIVCLTPICMLAVQVDHVLMLAHQHALTLL